MPDLRIDSSRLHPCHTDSCTWVQPAVPAGSRTALAAAARIRAEGWAYAYSQAPTSLYANLSGNRQPGITRPAWLRNNNKCNQFVGDVLTDAGFRMPTYRMRDGSEHYMMAEALPQQLNFFDRLTDLRQVQPGDVIVLDYGAARGASGAHTEVVTSVDLRRRVLQSAGAHSEGADIRNQWGLFSGAVSDPAARCWTKGQNRLYILRPKE